MSRRIKIGDLLRSNEHTFICIVVKISVVHAFGLHNLATVHVMDGPTPDSYRMDFIWLNEDYTINGPERYSKMEI